MNRTRRPGIFDPAPLHWILLLSTTAWAFVLCLVAGVRTIAEPLMMIGGAF